MIRIVFFSDTHLGCDLSSRSQLGINRGERFFRNFETVVDAAIGMKADVLVHCGDLFNRSQPPDGVVMRAYEKLLLAAERMPVLLLAGNHERSELPPSLFLQHPGIHIFHEPGLIQLRIKNDSLAFSGFPYSSCIRREIKSLIRSTGLLTASADFRYLCMHQTVAGATVGPGNYTFYEGRDVVARQQIPAGLTGVLCGHIHRRQVLDAKSPVIYCGSTERSSFAEADETKGYYVLSPDVDGVEFVPLPSAPMANLALDANAGLVELQDKILEWSLQRDIGSLIRLKFREFPGYATLKHINAKWLDSTFPDALSVSLSFPRK